MRPDVVQPLRPEGDGYGSDVRGHKLLAYTQSPFERTIFLDGDTFVRTARVEMLFDALEVGVGVRIRVRLRVRVGVGSGLVTLALALALSRTSRVKGWSCSAGPKLRAKG